jgi:hypothetical protein
MAVVTSCPLEIEAVRKAMEKPVRMYSAVGVNGVKHYHDEEGWEERYQADIDKVVPLDMIKFAKRIEGEEE